jgi:hypothetical protein
MTDTPLHDGEISVLAKAINNSGFPFQLGVKAIANRSPEWSAVLTEHPWRDLSLGAQGFIDLVIRDQHKFVNLVVECKRTREADWMFLRQAVTSEHSNNTSNVRVRVIGKHRTEGTLTSDWLDTSFVPGSPEANFCHIRKQGGAQRDDMLEKACDELLTATEALARQELALHLSDKFHIRRVYVPVIVTNARIFICDGNWEEMDPATGEVKFSAINPVPFVRFRKSFSAPDAQDGYATNAEAFAERSARTVVVVQAGGLPDFLLHWRFGKLKLEFMDGLLG